MIRLQEWIHQLELGSGARVMRVGLAVLGFLVLAGLYDWREYRNFANEEAMDQAQLARNLAAGRGFTTDFVRPLSVAILEDHAGAAGSGGADPARLKGPHPDLANAPLYPLVLAGLMKIFPFGYRIPEGVAFRTYQPEVWIAFLNQLLFFASVWLTFVIARRLFDTSVGWLAAVVFAGTDLFWRFSVSGLSTMLLQVWLLVVVYCLVRAEETSRDAEASFRRQWLFAAACGAATAAGALTRYSFGWLLVAVVVFFLACFPRRRLVLASTVVGVFALALAPWVARNVALCGHPFGTAGFAVAQETAVFPGDTLMRSLVADTSEVQLNDYTRKGLVGAAAILRDPAQWAGGNWFGLLFLGGLFIPFVHAGRSRLRNFLVGAAGVLAVAQVLGRTHLSTGGLAVHSENLLVLLAPLALMFSAAVYRMLSDQVGWLPHLHRWLTGIVVLLASAPLVLTFLPPHTTPLAYPPYAPPLVERCAGWMSREELLMSDIPWAVAWYGDRQCIWTTLRLSDPRRTEDFYAVNDTRKAIKGLYLTQVTLEGRFFDDVVRAGEGSWGHFTATSVLQKKLPAGFPLKHAPAGYLEMGQLFLADYARWSGPAN